MNPSRVATADIADGGAVALFEGRVLDVRDGRAIGALADELGEVDIVFSNAAARMSPDADPVDEVGAVAETNNVATTAILRAFAPRLRPGGRLIIVASALGTLDKLPHEQTARRFAAAAEEDLDAVDALIAEWRASVLSGHAEEDGFGAWLNTRRRSDRSRPSERWPASGGRATSPRAGSSWRSAPASSTRTHPGRGLRT